MKNLEFREQQLFVDPESSLKLSLYIMYSYVVYDL